MARSGRRARLLRAATLALPAACALHLAAGRAAAGTLVWDANAGTAGRTDGAGAWLGAGQWWNGSGNVDWAGGDDAVFGNAGAGGAVTLSGPTSASSLAFNYFTGTYTLGTAGQAITLGNGVTKGAGPGVATVVSPVTLGAAQTWTNNNSESAAVGTTYSLNAYGGVDNGGFTLTVDGTGTTSFATSNTNVISGAGGLTKNGTGVLVLSGVSGGGAAAHTYTGTTTINGGVVRIQNGNNSTGTGNLTLNGGVLEYYFSGTYARSLGSGAGQIQILGGTSGFSGQGATSTGFTIGTSGSVLQWGSAFFNPTVFVLQAATANTNGKMSLNNALDLNGATRTIGSFGGDTTGGATVTGAIGTSTGTAGLTKVGVGNLILTAANTYNGATTIAGGTLTLSGSGTVNATSGVALSGGGTLRLVNTAQVNRVADAAGITSYGGAISYENTSGTPVYTELLGSVGLMAGQLNVVQTTAQAGAGSQTLSLSGLLRPGAGNTSVVTFSAASTGPQPSGSQNMIAVLTAGTTAAGGIIGPWATTGTAAANQTDYAAYSGDYVVPAAIAASTQDAWSSASAAYTMSSGTGSTTLTATRNVLAVRVASPANNVTVDPATDVVSFAGHTFNNGDVFAFGGTAPTGATNGTVYYVRDVVAGASFKVAASPTGAAIDFTAAGTPNVTGGITLPAGANLGTTGILHGGASGLAIGGSGGVVTLPSASPGNLYVTAGNGAAVDVGVPVADNTAAGALTLVKSGSAVVRLNAVSTYTGNTVVNAGTLQVGTNGTANGARLGGATGNYAGDIVVAAGATLSVQTDAAQTLAGAISGGGNLVKSYSGTLTLSGANTYTGKTSITPLTTAGAGTLVVSSFNSVNGGTPLLSSSSLGAPTTVANGTIDFGNGSIQGGGTLTYTGPGETTDRVVNFVFNGTGAGKTLDASGTGLLKFTSTFTATGSATNDITLQGSGSGEIVGGLPFAFRNLTKSGAGTWTLGGTAGGTGAVAVSAGRLVVNNAFTSTESGTGTGAVSITATLSGTGQIAPGSANAVTVGNNGTLAPGSGGIGTLTVNSANTTAAAALAFTGTGKLLMELGPGLSADRVRIAAASAGDVSFSNTVVNFTDLTAGNLAPGVYTLLTADTAGAYAGLTTNPDSTIATGLTIGIGLSAYPGSTLALSGNDIVLNVVPEPGAASLAALACAGLLSRRRRRRR